MSVPLANRLETLRSLAEVSACALPLGLNAVTTTPEGLLAIATPPQPSRLTFVVDGLPFHAAVSPDEGTSGGGAVCQVWAEVGHIPYTVQAPDRRRKLLMVLRGIQAMPLRRARFVVQDGQKILLAGETRVAGRVAAEDLIHQTVLLLHEARPFLRLLAEHL
ncbi:MAG TPA: hypothetical protein VGE72_05975 [Azospirillum sp.]